MSEISPALTIPFEIGTGGRPPLEPEAAYLYQQLQPMAGDDEDTGWVTAHLCAVLMKPVESVSQLAAADGTKPGWRRVVDVDNAPAQLLPWLGQFNGTPLDATEPAEEQRRKIREARGSHRGTVKAIVSDLKATLTGTKFVQVLEGEGSPFANTFVVLASEVPDMEASTRAITNRATKPLTTVNTLIASDSPIINQFTREINAITANINTLVLADVT